MTDRPPCLKNTCVRRALNRYLDMLDKQPFEGRSKRLTDRILPKHFPELFSPREPGEDDVTWHHLTQLEALGIVTFERTRTRGVGSDAPWEHTRIVIAPEGEPLMRDWLDRPVVDEESLRWQEAVSPFRHAFEVPELIRPANLGRLTQYKPAAVVERLAKIPEMLAASPLTLYQLSARLFWGDSKALKGKERLLDQLFSIQVTQMLSRPVLIEGTYRPGAEGILIVENMDTFLAASNGQLKSAEDLTILFAQGFKGTTSRIRTKGMARFYWSDSPFPDPQWLNHFHKAWFGTSKFPGSIYYFGDLDPAGLSIYRQMRITFPELEPWKTGYEGLVKALEGGHGHPLALAEKTNQGSLPETGCTWMEAQVIPVMRETGLCIDQEFFLN